MHGYDVMIEHPDCRSSELSLTIVDDCLYSGVLFNYNPDCMFIYIYIYIYIYAIS